MKFDEFRVLTFDCYGTLIDWETGILAALRPWATSAGISATDAEILGAFGEAESAAEHEMPNAIYPEILRATHARMAKHFGVIYPNDDTYRFRMRRICWGDRLEIGRRLQIRPMR